VVLSLSKQVDLSSDEATLFVDLFHFLVAQIKDLFFLCWLKKEKEERKKVFLFKLYKKHAAIFRNRVRPGLGQIRDLNEQIVDVILNERYFLIEIVLVGRRRGRRRRLGRHGSGRRRCRISNKHTMHRTAAAGCCRRRRVRGKKLLLLFAGRCRHCI
jgi:hypothetical protein